MQRIDEKTYIDDTLVTCAEYQLFIDEMREQRKYYQPDHWTSYQFPIGRAREPILGMRHSDAVAFCGWLTTRESGEWRFRLPTQKEVIQYPLQVLNQSSFGYWSIGADNSSLFSWVGLNLKKTRAFNAELPFSDKTSNNLNDAYTLAISRATSRPVDLDCKSKIENELDKISVPLDYERKRIAFSKTTQQNSDNIIISIDELIQSARNGLIFQEDRPISQSINLYIDRISQLTTDVIKAIELKKQFGVLYTLDNFLGDYLVQALGYSLDYYFDLLTLQERIAGHSPAFEGIRLVKERIR